VDEALGEVGTETTLPLVAYPNSGEIWDAARRAWTGTAGLPAGAAARWFALGARLIGGCCRTGPAMIRAVREALTAPASAAR
jgi:homocysteine S-methyltransferase